MSAGVVGALFLSRIVAEQERKPALIALVHD